MAEKKKAKKLPAKLKGDYSGLVNRISVLLDQARRTAVRVTNTILTATYWQIGRQIVEFEQGGQERAEYGEAVVDRLADDLAAKFGRGFSRSNLFQIRAFYQGWQIVQTVSGLFQIRAKSPPVLGSVAPAGKVQTVSGLFEPVPVQHLPAIIEQAPEGLFPLPWSHYVALMSVQDDFARGFYEDEAIIAGWSVRQLDRMISTQHYERTMLSRNKAAMLLDGRKATARDVVTIEETIRDSYVLEFLNLKDEYSESELEDAIIKHLEAFLLEMGQWFTFVARQHRIRIDGESFRMDLVLFHRVLRCLVIIDLKIGRFSHADAGQMNLYLNYAKENMMVEGENPPFGLILCSDKSKAVARYAMGGIKAKVFASRYLINLPDLEVLRQELLRTKHALETRSATARRRRK